VATVTVAVSLYCDCLEFVFEYAIAAPAVISVLASIPPLTTYPHLVLRGNPWPRGSRPVVASRLGFDGFLISTRSLSSQVPPGLNPQYSAMSRSASAITI